MSMLNHLKVRLSQSLKFESLKCCIRTTIEIYFYFEEPYYDAPHNPSSHIKASLPTHGHHSDSDFLLLNTVLQLIIVYPSKFVD